MDKKPSKYYHIYKFADNHKYKAEIGKDGVCEVDMRNLRNVDKIEYRSNVKHSKIVTVSLDDNTVDLECHVDLVDESANVELIVENAEEYESLYKAIKNLMPQQRDIIMKRYFLDMEIDEIANELGIKKQSINDRLNKIYKQLKKHL